MGYQIFHNYIREHEGLDGKTPAEACGIKVEGKKVANSNPECKQKVARNWDMTKYRQKKS
jgi:hypothetical protein